MKLLRSPLLLLGLAQEAEQTDLLLRRSMLLVMLDQHGQQPVQRRVVVQPAAPQGIPHRPGDIPRVKQT